MLACTYWFACFNFADPYLVDPVANATIVAALYACLRRRPAWFAVAMLVGIMDKETMILFAPLYVIVAWARREPWRGRDMVGGGAITVAAGVFYFGFHAYVRSKLPSGGGYAPLTGTDGHSITNNFRSSVSAMKDQQQFAIFDTAHFLWLFFLFGLYYCYRRNGWRNETLALGAYTFVVCSFGRLFASDLQRVYAMMTPVIILVAAVYCLSLLDTGEDRLWIIMLSLVYVAINLRWVPVGTNVYLDLAAIAVFIVKVELAERGRTRAGMDGGGAERVQATLAGPTALK